MEDRAVEIGTQHIHKRRVDLHEVLLEALLELAILHANPSAIWQCEDQVVGSLDAVGLIGNRDELVDTLIDALILEGTLPITSTNGLDHLLLERSLKMIPGILGDGRRILTGPGSAVRPLPFELCGQFRWLRPRRAFAAPEVRHRIERLVSPRL